MRNNQLDSIRVVAITCIVISHYLMFNGIADGFGRYLAGGGNVVFFLLSAMLYGHKWTNCGRAPFDPKGFLWRRIIRIGCVLWPFLMILLMVFYICDAEFSIRQAVANFLFLGAFVKLPGNGHLWFLTVIMMSYVEYVLLSRVATLTNTSLMLLSFCNILVYTVLESMSMPGNFVLILTLTAWMFIRADKISKWEGRVRLYPLLLGTLFFNIFTAVLLENGLFDTYRIIAYPLMDICGVSWFIVLSRVLSSAKVWLVSFINGISFELYLVHHTLCAGPITKVADWSELWAVQFLLLVLVSVILAYVLHCISNLILKWRFLR